MKPLTDEQMKILHEATRSSNGLVEGLGRYRVCDALARRGLLEHVEFMRDGSFDVVPGPVRRRLSRRGYIRDDIFRITPAGRMVVR